MRIDSEMKTLNGTLGVSDCVMGYPGMECSAVFGDKLLRCTFSDREIYIPLLATSLPFSFSAWCFSMLAIYLSFSSDDDTLLAKSSQQVGGYLS